MKKSSAATMLTAFALAAAKSAAGEWAIDFAQPAALDGWQAQHDLSPLSVSPEGLTATVLGPDPYFAGPPLSAPAGVPLWLFLRWRSEAGGAFQVFHFRDHPSEEHSRRGSMPAGAWEESRIALPPLPAGTRLRIDPPGDHGTFTLASLRFEPRPDLPPLAWPKPAPGAPLTNLSSIGSAELSVQPAATGWRVLIDGEPVAAAGDELMAAYQLGNSARWLTMRGEPPRREGDALLLRYTARDEGGAAWQLTQRLGAGPQPGSIRVEAALTIDSDRTVFAAQLLALHPGLDTFGTNKVQGLLAGLEYLDNEPGSSTADLEGPESGRRLPLPHKVTFPLMAITHGGRHVGLIWEPAENVIPLFDSPAQLSGIAAHTLGLVALDTSAAERDEGNFSADAPLSVPAGQPVRARGWLIGGKGERATDAVRHYLVLHSLPAVPDTGYDKARYAALAAAGWLDSGLRDGPLFRHAAGPSWKASPAADAAAHLLWLSTVSADSQLVARLCRESAEAIAQVPPGDRLVRQIGHVKTPAPPLVFGPMTPAVEEALRNARGHLAALDADGTMLYRPRAAGPDYGRTSLVPHASGLSAVVAATALESALLAGDRELLAEALARVRGLALYRGGVPRGAQTWEIPLHTPDILAAAHLVRAFALAYEVTREPDLLQQAIEWAWSGVPFVYLVQPAPGPVGVYNTIAVYGATNWKAPVWLGLPVQWCGLVYADALFGLARHDPQGPWLQLAKGITAAGLQHTYPMSDRQRVGLLPDSFDLLQQERRGPDINPLTLGVCAARYFGGPPLADFRCVGGPRWRVSAPGAVEVQEEGPASASVRVRSWSPDTSFVHVAGLRAGDELLLDGRAVVAGPPHEGGSAAGWMALRVGRNPHLVIKAAAAQGEAK
jgi:hypothetical protein